MSSDSDDEFWQTVNKGFDFGSDPSVDGTSKLDTSMKKEKVDLLKCSGINEAIDSFFSYSPEDFLPARVTPVPVRTISDIARELDPLVLVKKRSSDFIHYEPEDTVLNMILGLQYTLDVYKGKDEKITLLQHALSSHDGNAIIEVILFMRKTLKKSIFQREIIHYPDAVNVYLAYLERQETEEHINMLLFLDKPGEAAIAKYHTTVKVQNPDRKLKWLDHCLRTHFRTDIIPDFHRMCVDQHKQLLEEEIEIQKFNEAHPSTEVKSRLLYESLTGKKSIIDASVMSCLVYCFLHYYKAGELQLGFANPERMKANYNLTAKQYSWAALRAFSASGKWADIDDLILNKNWIGIMKKRSLIGFPRILEVLSKAKAPPDVMKKYVAFVEGEKKRLELAQKYKCHTIAFEIFKYNKDRLGLIKYRSLLEPHSLDFCIATAMLNDKMLRWKN